LYQGKWFSWGFLWVEMTNLCSTKGLKPPSQSQGGK
jgi:hypothetical protein